MVFFYKQDTIDLPVKYSTLSGSGIYLVREAYLVKQKGYCYHCHGSLHLPPGEEITEKRITGHLYPHGFFKRPVHLHHNHDTDMTIGVVHAYCNAVLWEYHNE